MQLVKLISFGFKHHNTPEPSVGQVVVDIRTMFRNPWHEPALRYKDGRDAAVQQYIMGDPRYSAMLAHVREIVTAPGVTTGWIGCAGGHHRSVCIVERLGAELGVQIEHRDLDRA